MQCCCIYYNEGVRVRPVDLDGAAHRVLAAGVEYLDPQTSVFEAMLSGWQAQQQSRFLRADTIGSRLRLIRRFAEFTGLYPWQWTPGEVEAFTASLVSGERPLAHSTVRSYQVSIELFCAFITDPRYGWPVECERRFGQTPVQICHEWNTVGHLADYEGRPGRRAFSYDELQALFDAADARVEDIRSRGRKGALAALRDAILIKTVYAYGLRRRETTMLDLVDFRRNPRQPAYGMFGSVQVRYGKASRGSPPKRRTVLTVPEMDWVVDLLGEWCEHVRPLFDPGSHPALWVTERRGRLTSRHLNEAFVHARQDADLPAELDLHCLRHSYVTHLLEFGYPPLFVQQQVGHAHQSTTGIYTSVSDEFRNRMLEQTLRTTYPQLWEAGS